MSLVSSALFTISRDSVSHGPSGARAFPSLVSSPRSLTGFVKVMYEATLSQVHNLCTLAPPMNSGKGEFIDALVRARIFWYAHILDGVTSGLRGGRIWLWVILATRFTGG